MTILFWGSWVQVLALVPILAALLEGSRWWSCEQVPATPVGDLDWVLGSWLLLLSPSCCRCLGSESVGRRPFAVSVYVHFTRISKKMICIFCLLFEANRDYLYDKNLRNAEALRKCFVAHRNTDFERIVFKRQNNRESRRKRERMQYLPSRCLQLLGLGQVKILPGLWQAWQGSKCLAHHLLLPKVPKQEAGWEMLVGLSSRQVFQQWLNLCVTTCSSNFF